MVNQEVANGGDELKNEAPEMGDDKNSPMGDVVVGEDYNNSIEDAIKTEENLPTNDKDNAKDKNKTTINKYGELPLGHRLRTFRHSNTFIYSFIIISSMISLFASFVLSLHAIDLAANKNAVFSCDVNTVISCGTVGNSWQASAFGFPNSFIGLMFEPVIIFIGILGLLHVRIPKKLMVLVNVVYGLALIFALWLFFESVTVIHALCPYCLLVTLGTGLVFFGLLHLNLRDNNFNFSEKYKNYSHSALFYYADSVVSILFIVAIIFIILYKYGEYLFTF